ncbi:MAG: hypothetical protein J5755_02240 [Clostridia bacterium]|nr:hypothetical protein [Clostridia bacterium]
MKSKLVIAFALVLIVAVVLVGCASGSFQVEAGKELTANSTMEKVTDSKLDDWAFATGDNAANPTIVSVDPDSAAYDPQYGTRYVRISSNSKGSYTLYKQEVQLERGAVYRLSIDVRVTTAIIASGVRSAFVGLAEYDYVFASTAAKADWTKIDVYFRNDVADDVTVVWGLGSTDSLVTSGVAQFDNVSLVKLSAEDAEGIIALNLKDSSGNYRATYTKTLKDTLYVVLTTVLFFLVGVAAFFGLKHFFNKSVPSVDDGPQGNAPAAPKSKGTALLASPTLWLVVALVVGFGMRLLLALTVFGYGAYGNQVMTDASLMAEKGLFQSYVDINSYYAPFANYLLYFLGLLAIPFKLTAGTLGMAIFVKIPAILADLILTVVLFTVLHREKGLGVAAIVSGLFALCPVTFAASGIWGVFAPVGVLFLVLALLALRDRKIILLTVYYTLSVLFMQEALLLMPLLLAWAVVTYIKYPETRIMLPVCATVAIVAGYALTVPLAINYFILARPFVVLERYVGYFTSNGFFGLNLFGLYGMCAVSANAVNVAGNAFSGIFAALVLLGGIGLYVVRRNRQDLILAAAWSMAGILVLCTHVDMWLILPVLVLLGLYAMLAGEKRVALVALAWSVLATVNVGYALWVGGNIQGGLGSTAATIASADPVMITFSVFTVLLFAYLTYVAIDVCVRERKVLIDPIANTVERVKSLFGRKSKQANE